MVTLEARTAEHKSGSGLPHSKEVADKSVEGLHISLRDMQTVLLSFPRCD